MLCTKCGKNEATVYFSQTLNGNTTEMHLCPHCAKESRITDCFSRHESYIRNSLFSMPSIFGNHMGMSFDNMLSAVGLADSIFNFNFEPVAINDTIKSSKTETATKPEPCPETTEDKISKLRAKLDEAVKSERYEDAARFRDEIKSLEK